MVIHPEAGHYRVVGEVHLEEVAVGHLQVTGFPYRMVAAVAAAVSIQVCCIRDASGHGVTVVGHCVMADQMVRVEHGVLGNLPTLTDE